MAKSRNDILFKYLADTRNLEKGNKTVRKSMGGISDTAKSAGKALAGAFAVREIAQFAASSVTAASDYEESINAVEVATGAAAREIKQFGDTAATALGLSKTEVNEAAVAFAAFGEKIDTDGNIADTFEDFATRATDFASVMNIDVAEALTKFQSGLAGESEPLRRYGIDISAAAVNTFAYANGIAEAGKQLSETEKVQARYGLLLEETNKFAGDFANTSESMANTQKILNAEIENAKIELGRELMPVYRDFLSVSLKLLPALKSQIKGVGDLVGTYESLAGIVGGVTDGIKGQGFSFDDAEGAARGLFDIIGKVNPAMGLLGRGMEFVTGQTLGVIDEFKILNPLMETATVIAGQYGDANRDAAGAVRDLDSAQEDLEAGFQAFDPGAAIQSARDFIQLRDILGAQAAPVINFNGVVGDPAEVAQQIKDLLEFDSGVNGAL